MTPTEITIPESTAFDSLLSLKGKCAIVTGGSRGLGEAIVHRLAEAGAAVIFTGRGVESLRRVESEIAAKGATAIGVQADVSNLEDSRRVTDLAVERFGRLDILVNNAATFPVSTAMEMTEALWDKTFAVDSKGAFFASKFAAEAMIAAGHGGRIINILSTAAFRVASVFTAYGAAKQGLWYTTQAMAQELAEHHILVNAVTPGATLTAERIAAFGGDREAGKVFGEEMTTAMSGIQSMLGGTDIGGMITKMMPTGRTGFPDDIAKAVLFLASDMGSYISGVNITVDGAQSLHSLGPGGGFGGGPDHESASKAESVPTSASAPLLVAPDPSLEGRYSATIKTPMGTQELLFAYHVQDGSLTGTVAIAGKTTEVEDGKVNGNTFSHQYRFKTPMGKVKVQVNGQVEGDKLTGILKTPMGNIPFDGTRVKQ